MAISSSQILLLTVAPALICAFFIILAKPLLLRFALTYPNYRSSHREPTPQGGGIAVIGATVVVLVGTEFLMPKLLNGSTHQMVGLIFATVGLAIVGASDDVRPLPAVPRLLLQAVAAFIVVVTLPEHLRIFSTLPWLIERIIFLFAVLWFINLVNFMDGIDWMTVVEVVPVTGGLMIAGLLGALPGPGLAVSAVLFGAIIGFAPFNRPTASLFLGDVGSLSIGLILAWLLILLASAGHLTAALLLPLYYLADATITLGRRMVNREPLMSAHRRHFYQQAVDQGLTVPEVVSKVFAINIALMVLSLVTILVPGFWTDTAILLVAAAMVGGLLLIFAKGARITSHSS